MSLLFLKVPTSGSSEGIVGMFVFVFLCKIQSGMLKEKMGNDLFGLCEVMRLFFQKKNLQ